MVLDIFESGFQFPSRVDILAPGPNGKPYWPYLGSWVMAVNSGVLVPVDADAWCVSDWWAVKTPWFFGALDNFDGLKFFALGLYGKCGKAEYTFKLLDGRECVKPIGTGLYEASLEGLIRPDGSVSATAVELSARLGAKEIVLCGVDMYGDSYFDGAASSSVDCPHVGEWAFTPFFNSLIEWVRGQGIDIWSMSETTLEVEVREP